jgi:cephalosporin hydroxylase
MNNKLPGVRALTRGLYRKLIRPPLHRLFFTDLIEKTNNFGDITWLGQPVWQNALDLWTIQETIFEVKPELLVECGTNRGGSAFFYAQLFDLMGSGHVITVDIERIHEISHPRITFLLGSSVAPEVLEQMHSTVSSARGPVMVILDSDHSASHVSKELESYSPFVTPGSFMLVQDGVIDVLGIFRRARPGPLPAIRRFLKRHPEFEADLTKSSRFLLTHHPLGWLRRMP